MSWIPFIVAASFIWSVTNIIDKYLIDKKVKKPLILTIFVRAGTLIPLALIIPFIGFSLPDAVFLPILLIAGIFASFGVYYYYKAIQIGEISIIIPTFQLIPIFVLFLSYFLLNEVLCFFDYLGFVIIIIGGLVITAKSFRKIFKIEKVLWLIVISSMFYAISDVSLKYSFTNVEYWSAFVVFWVIQALVLISFLAVPRIRRDAAAVYKKLNKKDKTVLLSVAVLSFTAHVLGNYAIKLGPVSLVDVFINTEFIFTFLLAVILTKFMPSIIKERIDRRTTLQKVIGMLTIIIGVMLVQLL